MRVVDLAPEDQKATMFGAYYLVRDTIVALAAFAGGLLWSRSPATNLLTASAFGLLGTIWFAWRGRDLTGELEWATPVTPASTRSAYALTPRPGARPPSRPCCP